MGNTEIVREFIKEIKEKYPNIKMSYSYDEKEDETEIFYHLKEKSSYEFESLMGKMLYEKFHKSEIYNIYFNLFSIYNDLFYKKLKKYLYFNSLYVLILI